MATVICKVMTDVIVSLSVCRNDDLTLQLMMGYRKGKRVMKRVLPMLSDVGFLSFF